MWQEDVEAGIEEALAAVLVGRGLTTDATATVRRPPAGCPGDWSTAVARAVATWRSSFGSADRLARDRLATDLPATDLLAPDQPARDRPTPAELAVDRLAADLAAELRTREWVAGAHQDAGHVVIELTPEAVVADLLDVPGDEPAQVLAPPLDDLYDVRLAHARGRNTHRSAERHGVLRIGPDEASAAVVDLLGEPHVRDLLLLAAGSRNAVARAHHTGRTEPVVAHLRRTAAAFDAWCATTRVSPRGHGAITSAHRIRLCLNDVITAILARGLASIGLDAPEHL